MKHRSRLLFLVWGALGAVLLLVSGLPGLILPPRRFVDLSQGAGFTLADLLVASSLLFIPLYIVILFFFLSALRSRKTITGLLVIAAILLLVGWVVVNLPQGQVAFPETVPATPQAESETAEELPQEEFIVVEPDARTVPPDWAATLVSMMVTALLLLAVAGLVWRYRTAVPPEPDPLADLSQEAVQALDALQSGATLRNVVLRCYAEMGRVIDETQGVRRAETMTPREFESQLTSLGLPREPVVVLSRLFESFRYGRLGEPDATAEQQAQGSLRAIVAACRELS